MIPFVQIQPVSELLYSTKLTAIAILLQDGQNILTIGEQVSLHFGHLFRPLPPISKTILLRYWLKHRKWKQWSSRHSTCIIGTSFPLLKRLHTPQLVIVDERGYHFEKGLGSCLSIAYGLTDYLNGYQDNGLVVVTFCEAKCWRIALFFGYVLTGAGQSSTGSYLLAATLFYQRSLYTTTVVGAPSCLEKKPRQQKQHTPTPTITTITPIS